MMMAASLRYLDQLLHTADRGRPLNVDESGRLPVRLYGPDGQPLFTEQNPAHVKGEVTPMGQDAADGTFGLMGSFVRDDNGRPIQRTIETHPVAYDELRDEIKTRQQAREEIARLVGYELSGGSGPVSLFVGDLDVRRFRMVQIIVVASAEHTWQLAWSGMVGQPRTNLNTITPRDWVMGSQNEPMLRDKITLGTAEEPIDVPFLRLEMRNLSSEPHTYDVIVTGVY